jgi:hypothetical protein
MLYLVTVRRKIKLQILGRDYILMSFKLEKMKEEQQIMLDKSTAIKFAKMLHTEIKQVERE